MTLARSPCAVWFSMVMPTVVSAPRPRQRRPSVMASLTDPPLESSTMVAPSSWRPRANSSKSLGVSAVTMPTALIQPRQFGWQSTQLNRIGNFRSSSDAPACAEPPSGTTMPGNTMQRAAAPSSAQLRRSSDLTSLKSVPSPKPPKRAVAMAPVQHHINETIPSHGRYEKRNRAKRYRP